MALLAGRTAVVTGGAQGLGYAIAHRFVAEGARVVLGDLNLDATRAAAGQLGGDAVARAVRCDVTSAEQVQDLVDAAVRDFGGLDVMVNNAGITRDATLRKMTEEQFDEVIAVHLKGTWNGTRLAAAVMREQGSGAIINMSSISGKVGLIGQTNYSAAKAGIVGTDQSGRQGTRASRCSGQRDPTGADPFGHDRGHAATDLGRQAGRGADGSRRRARRGGERWRCSWRRISRRT